VKALCSAILTLLISSILGEIFWDSFIDGPVYHCTDDIGRGFIFPGDWYHPGPDWIKEGWSNGRLWEVWSSIAAVVIVLTLFAAWLGSRSCRPA
jgi:hypothetical protein